MNEKQETEWSFAKAFAEENELHRRRFVHATRSKHPMSMAEAMELSERMQNPDFDKLSGSNKQSDIAQSITAKSES